MSSGIIDAVRDLAKQLPNLSEIVREATTEKAKPIAETAYIYNGFDDITLPYLGAFYYHLKKGQVTRIDGKPDYREINQNDTIGAKIEWRLIPLKGESIARELIETRELDKRGLIVLLEPTIRKEVRDACDAVGLQFILTEIERFKVGRDKARAGIAGYKIKPDPDVYRWMKVHTPDDELFGEQHRKADSQGQIAQAIDLLTKFVTQQKPAVEAEAPVDTSNSELTLPRRKPLEKEEDYAKRIAAFKGE